MNYPLISEYVEAIKAAEDNFDQLNHLRPVLGENGEPVMTSGNFAVVFKMKDEQSGKLHAVKCFTKEQERRAEAYREIAKELKDVSSPYLVSIRYLEKELFVDTDQTAETEFPVLLMDWVEGKTLDKYLRENLDDKYALEMLAYRFSQLAQWLIPQPFAHGDLKPDNILVREDGTLVLVDYDGMYVPSMKGQKARELGSPDFRHPLRTENDFDEHIDDFPLVSILLSLKAISFKPLLLLEYGAKGRLLFAEIDYRLVAESKLIHHMLYMVTVKNIAILYSLFLNSLLQHNYFIIDVNLLHCNLTLSGLLFYTRVFQSDLNNYFTDNSGGRYSKDKKRLLSGSNVCGIYEISTDAEVVCNDAFSSFFTNGNNLKVVVIPENVKVIGRNPFALQNTKIVNLSSSFIVENDALYTQNKELLICYYGDNIDCFEIPEGVKYIGGYAFAGKNRLKCIKLPPTVVQIGEFSFADCNNLENVVIPNSLRHIGTGAFYGCGQLNNIVIPDSVVTIGDRAFAWCHSIKTLTIPESVISIGANPFMYIDNLSLICKSPLFEIENDTLYSIGKSILISCFSRKQSFEIPKEVNYIGCYSFNGCMFRELYIHDNITYMGYNAFDGFCYEGYVMKILVSKGRLSWAQKRVECGMVVEEVDE
ncbi:MAG: leucine-rich repeat protein [Prevotella sp.]|nr:leucine-rich repeat protein [Prevotella sp.]